MRTKFHRQCARSLRERWAVRGSKIRNFDPGYPPLGKVIMSNYSRLLIGLLSVVVFAGLWPTGADVRAQVPTKTPIGPPPTKPLLSEIAPTQPPLPTEAVAPPTKTPLPTNAAVPPTKTPLPTEAAPPAPTATPRPTSTAAPTPIPQPNATTAPASVASSPALATATSAPVPTRASLTPTAIAPTITLALVSLVIGDTATPVVPSPTAPVNGSSASVDPPDSSAPLIVQAVNIGGLVLGLAVLGLFIWFGLSRLGRSITNEIRTVSLATLRLQHEAERLDRRAKVAFRADSDVLALLEQASLDASGESVHLRLLPNGWLSSPPLLAVVDQNQTRYIFSPLPPDQVKPLARRNGLTQFLLGQATDLTAYPIDAVTSTPFIADDMNDAFGSVLSRHQTQRRPLPRTDRCISRALALRAGSLDTDRR